MDALDAMEARKEGRGGSLLRLARIAALCLIIPGGYLVLLLTLAPLAPFPRALVRWRSVYFRRWSRLTLGLVGVRVAVRGTVPQPPFLLVSNHLSYLDILVLAANLPCIFVSKAEVQDWPLMGRIVRTLGTIFVDRSSRRDVPRVLAEMEEALGRGLGVVLFPEGTSTRGATVEPFKSPLLALAARLERPVHCAALGYRTRPGDLPADLAICWWGKVPFVPHALRLLRLRGGEATITLAPEPVVEPDRKRLAERLRQSVLACFEPVEALEPPAAPEAPESTGRPPVASRPGA